MGFTCGSGETVAAAAACDLVSDCSDGSDELQNCAQLQCGS